MQLINVTCCIFSKFSDGLSSQIMTLCFLLECPSVGLTWAQNAECFDNTVTLPGGLELNIPELDLLENSSLISSSEELSFPDPS